MSEKINCIIAFLFVFISSSLDANQNTYQGSLHKISRPPASSSFGAYNSSTDKTIINILSANIGDSKLTNEALVQAAPNNKEVQKIIKAKNLYQGFPEFDGDTVKPKLGLKTAVYSYVQPTNTSEQISFYIKLLENSQNAIAECEYAHESNVSDGGIPVPDVSVPKSSYSKAVSFKSNDYNDTVVDAAYGNICYRIYYSHSTLQYQDDYIISLGELLQRKYDLVVAGKIRSPNIPAKIFRAQPSATINPELWKRTGFTSASSEGWSIIASSGDPVKINKMLTSSGASRLGLANFVALDNKYRIMAIIYPFRTSKKAIDWLRFGVPAGTPSIEGIPLSYFQVSKDEAGNVINYDAQFVKGKIEGQAICFINYYAEDADIEECKKLVQDFSLRWYNSIR